MFLNKEVKLDDVFPIIEEQLNCGGVASFEVHGTSMLPFFKDRISCVKLKKPQGMPKKYDIIFYRNKERKFILHRIVKIKNGQFICRGDNHVDNEIPINFEDIIGVVFEYNRKGKWKSVKSLSQISYSRFWVNTMIIRKIKRKIFSIFKTKK